MQRKQIQAISFLALFALMVILMSMLFLPFSSVILWSSVFYIVFSPLYAAILRRMNSKKKLYEIKRHLLAGSFALGTMAIMVGIFVFIGFQLIGQGRLFLVQAQDFVAANPHFFSRTELGMTIASLVHKVSLGTVDISTMDIKAEVLKFLATYADNIGGMTRNLLKDIGGFLLSLAFMSFTLYFFYIDGSYLAHVLVTAIPIDQKSTKKLIMKFRDVTTNLFMGFFLVAFYQAAAAFVILFLFRVDGSLLFSVLILFSSFIPIFGTALIWFPIGVTLLLTRGMAAGISFLILCAIFISFLDNFLRPFFLKDRIKIHPLLIFFSILGGLQVFGFNGILLGPVIIILFFTIVDIALEDELQPHHPAEK